MVPWMA
jgi:hypothetical protein